MNKIVTYSKWIKGLLTLLLVIHLSALSVAVYSGQPEVNAAQTVSGAKLQQKATVSGTWEDYALALEEEGLNSLLWLVGAETIYYITMYVLLLALFSRIQRGDVFSEDTVNSIRRVAKVVLGWAVFTVFYPLLLTILFRTTGMSDSLPIHIVIGTTELASILIAIIGFVAASVFAEALSLKREQELTI